MTDTAIRAARNSTDGPIIQKRWLRWAAILGFYLLIALYFCLQNVIRPLVRGREVEWDLAVGSELAYWLIWALWTPFILWCARRFRIEKEKWIQTLPMHVGLALLIAPLQEGLWRLVLYLAILGRSVSEMSTAWPQWRGNWLVGSLTSFYKYWLVIGIYYSFDYYGKYRRREQEAIDLQLRAAKLETQLTNARLDALRMQLHPHFLFNTLNAISVLINSGEVERANEMLLHLGDLLRVALENEGAREVSLKQELDFLRRYLEIERIRFEDRLTVRMEIDPKTLDAQVPNLILQPLVENAVRHGVAARLMPGQISVTSRRRDSRLVLEVWDDGPGLKDGPVEEGVGLANTRARLNQHYGDDHRFELGSAREGGLHIALTIPFHTV